MGKACPTSARLYNRDVYVGSHMLIGMHLCYNIMCVSVNASVEV